MIGKLALEASELWPCEPARLAQAGRYIGTFGAESSTSQSLTHLFKMDPQIIQLKLGLALRPLRADPRYNALLRRMGLPT